jgi:hypothetical protein
MPGSVVDLTVMNGMLFVAVRAVRPADAPPPILRGVPGPHQQRAAENAIVRFFTQPVHFPRVGRKWADLPGAEAR